MDANGNSNTATFVFKFCVDQGPDTTPPLIVTTDLLNNNPISYNTTSADIEVYVNEPSECKWSHRDQSYDKMEETMECSNNVREMNAQMLYTCKTTLTGLKDRVKNKFYFRCKDQPWLEGTEKESDRNVNSESQPKEGFTIIGTQPLVISSVSPDNETIKDASDSVKITLKAETSAGYKDGESACFWAELEEEDNYVLFFGDEKYNNYKHSQDLYLREGDYEYYIKCCDLGNNCDYKNITFGVDIDEESPIVVRAYHEEDYLKLITNEEAECVYDTKDCNYQYEDGTKMSVLDETEHFTDWKTNANYYIKCQDEYKNQPFPNACSIIVRPFENFKES